LQRSSRNTLSKSLYALSVLENSIFRSVNLTLRFCQSQTDHITQYAANVTRIHASQVDQVLVDPEDAFELENEFRFHDGSTAENSGVQLFWVPESLRTDLNSVATPKNLKEVGRLTGCELSLDNDAGHVVIMIKNHHDDDEAAMMKMTIIERNHVSKLKWARFDR